MSNFWLLFMLTINCALALKPLGAREMQAWDLSIQQHGYVIVPNPYYDPGLFSVFCSVLGALNAFEEGYFKGISIQLTRGRYVDRHVGKNWWEYFFEPIHINMDTRDKKRRLSDFDLHKLAQWPLDELERHNGYALIQKYVHLKPHLQEKVDRLTSDLFGNSYMIGIHYRGTDKTLYEAERISYQRVVKSITQKIKQIPETYQDNYKIFVATDEQKFLEYVQKSFACPIVYSDAKRSVNDVAVHMRDDNDNYHKGEEALIDCLLLSRCDILIRTLSNLSFCSELFNPDLPVEVLK